MSGILEQNYQHLRQALRDFCEQAKHNENVLERMLALETHLLACDRVASFLEAVFDECKRHMKLHALTLWIVDPDNNIRELLTPLFLKQHKKDLIFISDESAIQSLYLDQSKPVLKKLDDDQRHLLFPHHPGCHSVAMLPLMRSKKLFASLHLGSEDVDRFKPTLASDFLGHLAIITGVAFENCFKQEHLERLSLVDMLTRVKNRRFFEQSLQGELSRAMRSGTPLSCLFIDLDYFKQVNDRYGHAVGDRSLRTIAQVIQQSLRQTDILARYGGEEFIVLLPSTDAELAINIAERIRHETGHTQVPINDHHTICITLSIGITTFNPSELVVAEETTELSDAFVRKADEALYQAKALGRNKALFLRWDGMIATGT